MKICVSLGVSLSLTLGSISPCLTTSFAASENFAHVFSENEYYFNASSLKSNELEDIVSPEDSDDFEDERIPFVPDRTIPFSEAVSEISDLLNQYKTLNDINMLKECILTFGEIPKISESLTNNAVKNNEQLKELFHSIRMECYNLDTIENQEVYVKLFAEEIFLGWKYDKNIEFFKDEFLIKGLIDYNKNRLINIQDRLDYLLFVIEFYAEMGDPFPQYNFIPQIDEQVYPDVPPSQPSDDEDNIYEEDDFYDDMIVIGPNGSNNNQGSGDSNNETIDGLEEVLNLTTYYKEIDSKCYKVTELTKNGNTTEIEKNLVDKSEYVYCGIYEYIDFGDGYASGHVDIDDEYINSNQNESSDYYVYYTVTNNEEAPYYYNTGIRADAISQTISYNQLKDILYHLAIKNKSFTTDANTKSLYIFNGTPVVLKETIDNSYTQSDIDRLLKPFNELGVKIMKDEDYKACQTKYEEAQAEKDVTYINDIIIDGTTIYEKEIAWIKDDILNVSIQTIANLLSAKTDVKNGYLTIEKDDSKIVLYDRKKEYLVNDEQKSFLTNVTIKRGQYISELADIPKLLGYNAEVDLDNNILIFTKI